MAKAQAISLVATEVPAHVLNAGFGRGNEDVGNAVAIPRIKLLQQLSKEVDKYASQYIEGAQPGDFVESASGTLLGSEIYLINVKFKIDYNVWRKYELGGGLQDTFKTEAEAADFVAGLTSPEEYEIKETHEHVVLVKDAETGKLSNPMLFDFTVSKLTTSRKWNTKLAQQGGDRFASLWKASSMSVESKSGQRFINLDVNCVGWTTEEDYKVAESVYETFSQ